MFGLGMIGVVVPGLPTTPFMILAAACFVRSSDRFYKLVINNKIFGKNYYIFSLTRLNTCQKDPQLLPQIGSQALISQLSEEIDFSIELNEKAALVLSYGIEKVLGNASTDIGDNPEASATNTFFEKLGLENLYRNTNYRNQKNTLFGFGLDYKIGQNAMIFYRYNQYRYFDPNFIENHLKGWEMILELKINF